MRLVIAIVTATLVLNLGLGSALAQTGDEWRWLRSLHMFDALTGWALSVEKGGGAFSRGAIGSVVRTTDGGLHWTDVTPQPPPGQRFSPQGVVSVRALTPLSAWLVTSVQSTVDGSSRLALFRTVDGGQRWTRITPSVSSFGVMDFFNDHDGWLVNGHGLFLGRDVHRSTDGGETWMRTGSAESLCRGRSITQSITFLNASTGWITGYCEDLVRAYHLATRDGGRNWERQELPRPRLARTAGALRVYAPLPPMMAQGDYPHHRLMFFTARDGILPIVYSYLDPQIHATVASYVVFYVTHDSGTTWMPTTPVALPDPDRCCLGVSFADVNHGWVTDGEVLYVTSDGARRWRKTQPRLPGSPLGEIQFTSAKAGWATGQLMQKPFLLKTLDGGRTWTSVPYAIVRQ